MQAGILSNAAAVSRKDIMLLALAVTPYSFGVKDRNGEMLKLVERNTTIPTRKVISLVTTVFDQQGLYLELYEGERLKIEGNTFLARYYFTGLTRNKAAGSVEIEVTIECNYCMANFPTLTASERGPNGTEKALQLSEVIFVPGAPNTTPLNCDFEVKKVGEKMSATTQKTTGHAYNKGYDQKKNGEGSKRYPFQAHSRENNGQKNTNRTFNSNLPQSDTASKKHWPDVPMFGVRAKLKKIFSKCLSSSGPGN